MNNCGCEGNIKAYFKLDYRPNKLSQLQNDMDYQNINDLNDSISEHNNSEQAHSYIQELISTAELNINTTIGDLTELDTSVKTSVVDAINSEVSARSNADTGLANDYNAKIGTLSNLESSVKTDVVSAINSVISDTDTTIGDLTDLDTSVKTSIVNAINSEVSDRTSADNDLQGQIDALSAASDVTDIVGTYADLEAYDTQHLNNNDIIKVLTDETHNDAPSYYRFNKTSNSFSYIGSESASYTKAEADATFVPLTRTVNSKALSADITLSASDVGALPSTTTINDLTTTAQQNALNSGATTSNIGQIATNTSSISTINSKIPSDATSSNKLVTASTLANAIVDFSNKDLSNLSDTGNNRLHALKSYSDTGELLTDSEGLTDITHYAHSTFDESKFTVVGSPVVTSDGIASGFSNSNYLTVSLSSVLPSSITSVTFECEFTYQTGVSTIFGCPTGQNNSPRIHISNDSVLHFYLYDGTDDNGPTINLSANNVQSGDNIRARVTYSNTNVTGTLWINNGTPIKISNNRAMSVNFVTALATVALGHFGSSYSTCPIDLKQFSITVDNIPVFSGNKTGIDTIKSADFIARANETNYTNPTLPFSNSGLVITEDGIASGFSSTNVVYKDVAYNDLTSIRVTGRIIYKTSGTTEQVYLSCTGPTSSTNTRNFYIVLTDTQFKADVTLNDTWQRITTVNFPATLKDNDIIDVDYTLTTSTQNYKVKVNGILVIDKTTTTALSPFKGTIIFAGPQNNNNVSKVDLNSIKVYPNGSLDYQPCLKIPYTLSKTGSKVVNHIYRDRVNDMYDQFGNAPYYTLSDTDFTLPQGELYGMIGQQTLRKSTVSGINRSFLYSDRTLLLTGSCTSGVEVTLPTAFSNANYMLSVPYSAKTATKFTPTQTGDWFAIGEGAL